MNNFNLYLQILEKAGFVLGSIIYFIFSLVIVKQVNSMTKNIKEMFNFVLISFAYIHLAFSVFLILLILILL